MTGIVKPMVHNVAPFENRNNTQTNNHKKLQARNTTVQNTARTDTGNRDEKPSKYVIIITDISFDLPKDVTIKITASPVHKNNIRQGRNRKRVLRTYFINNYEMEKQQNLQDLVNEYERERRKVLAKSNQDKNARNAEMRNWLAEIEEQYPIQQQTVLQNISDEMKTHYSKLFNKMVLDYKIFDEAIKMDSIKPISIIYHGQPKSKRNGKITKHDLRTVVYAFNNQHMYD